MTVRWSAPQPRPSLTGRGRGRTALLINLKYSQAGVQRSQGDYPDIRGIRKKRFDLVSPGPSCCSKDLLNNPVWICSAAVSLLLHKSGPVLAASVCLQPVKYRGCRLAELTAGRLDNSKATNPERLCC